MRKNSIDSIYIYYNKQNAIYYVQLKISGNEKWPNFSKMNNDQKKALQTEFPELEKALQTEFPELGNIEDISYEEIFKKEEINSCIKDKINEHNERCEDSIRTEWKMYFGGVLVPINEGAIKEWLERQKGNFVQIKYEGSADDSTIIEFIKSHESQKTYMVYYCDKCKKWQYGEVVNEKVNCKCTNFYSTEVAVARFKGDNALIKAAEKAIEKNTSSRTLEQPTKHTTRSFFYNEKTYGPSFQEFKLLHNDLYNDCAVDSIFFEDKSGEIVFQPYYKEYLRFTSERTNDPKLTKIYNEMQNILEKINDSSNCICGVMSGFYWYFKEYGLTTSTALHWRIGDTKYHFKDPSEYATTLCSYVSKFQSEMDAFVSKFQSEMDAFVSKSQSEMDAFVSKSQSEMDALISLYNKLTCEYFFNSYESSKIELSRLIFDKAGGRYIYIDENNKVTDFKKDFINELSVNDQVNTKYNFIVAIKEDDKFWENVRGSCSSEYYGQSSEEPAYELLCYYQFAIQGGKKLTYHSLEIDNSEDGVKYIQNVVSKAYLERDNEESQKSYQDLLSLFATSLLRKLEPISEGVMGQTNWIDKLKELLNTSSEPKPDVKAYLFCLSSVDMNVKFWFGDRTDTLLGHANNLINKAEKNGVKYTLEEYISSPEVKELLQYIFSEAKYKEISDQAEKAFKGLKETLVEFEKNLRN